MSNTTSNIDLQSLRNNLAAQRAAVCACEAELKSAEEKRLATIHVELGLPSTEDLISRLKRLSRAASKKPPLSAEVRAQVRADLAAGVSAEIILTKYNLSARTLGGIRGSCRTSHAGEAAAVTER